MDILQAITVDAICSDFNMKDGTGLDLLEDIRQRGISVPFLLMSGNDDYMLVQQTKPYGGVFCCKTDYDLIAKIEALINSELENFLSSIKEVTRWEISRTGLRGIRQKNW